jgi:hypothetical protein
MNVAQQRATGVDVEPMRPDDCPNRHLLERVKGC